ncbi:MAG: chromate efflux transporter [Xenococcaceae cyanobacterium MO_188.B19]|nr:chromate efflux transporter [Xenococcaceae cyanobacterium MO_188.B19]
MVEDKTTLNFDFSEYIYLMIPSLPLLFWTFLKIGSTAFGGLMSLIAVVENIVVEKMQLLSHEDILDGISLTTFLPGPISTNVVVYVGYRIRGKLGALVSLLGVILPSFCLITGLAAIYFQFGEVSGVKHLFLGFIPTVTAIIVSTAWQMSRKTIKDWRQFAIALTAAILLITVGGIYLTFSLMIVSGCLGWWLFLPLKGTGSEEWRTRETRRQGGKEEKVTRRQGGLGFWKWGFLGFLGAVVFLFKKSALIYLFLTFVGISLMLFGGAYVGIPLIQEIIVSDRSWLTTQEFAYGIALGQITPGPIVISAAFIGYKVQGILGAVAATLGIFTPPFWLMIGGAKILEWSKRSSHIQAAMKGIRPAVIGMIFAAAWIVGQTAELNGVSIAIFTLSLLALVCWRVNVIWLLLGAGFAGLLFYRG